MRKLQYNGEEWRAAFADPGKPDPSDGSGYNIAYTRVSDGLKVIGRLSTWDVYSVPVADLVESLTDTLRFPDEGVEPGAFP